MKPFLPHKLTLFLFLALGAFLEYFWLPMGLGLSNDESDFLVLLVSLMLSVVLWGLSLYLLTKMSGRWFLILLICGFGYLQADYFFWLREVYLHQHPLQASGGNVLLVQQDLLVLLCLQGLKGLFSVAAVCYSFPSKASRLT